MVASIHPTAIIEKGAELDHDTFIGPYCVIGSQVKIAKGTICRSHVVIDGDTTIGMNNIFDPFCVIGGEPQDVTYKGENTKVVIGDHNKFREACTVSRGTAKARGVTSVGHHNYVMAYGHLGHDSKIGNHVILVNEAQIGGHVIIEDYVVVGGQSAVTQKCRLGAYSFVGAHSVIRRDLPPYMAAKDFSEVNGPNLVGLKRQNLGDENIRLARELYKIYYLSSKTSEAAIEEITTRYRENPFAMRFVDFIKGSVIGVQR